MNKHIALASAFLASAVCGGFAHAHDRTQWSVTVGSQPRGVVMVPQTQYSYGAPPSVYSPPPVYAPPPVYVQPAPVYGPPPVVYVQPGTVYVNPPVRIESYPQRRWHDNERWHDGRHWNERRGDDRRGNWDHGHYRR